MAILNRLSRLFTADVHAVLDRIEEPEALLRQSLREMEGAVSEGARHLKLAAADLAKAVLRRTQLDPVIAAIAEELELSFAADNDELVRRCLRRRIQQQRQRTQLDQHCSQLEAEIASLTLRLAEQNEQLEGLRQKAELFDIAASDAVEPIVSDPYAVSDADVDLALLRELQARRAS